MTNPLLKHAQSKMGPKINTIATKQHAGKDGTIPMSEILVKSQVRQVFEDADNPLSELAENIKEHGLFQPILVRPIQGGEHKYELVAGERRFRACTMLGMTEILATVKAMTPEEAAEVQFSENIHRKNLTLREEALRIQRDLDENDGDVQAVLKKYNKPQSGKAWISKMKSLLNLTEQAQRLIDEDISADTEVILGVKRIEELDSQKAEEVVEKLRESKLQGKGEARKTVRKARAEIAPATGKGKKAVETGADSEGQKQQNEGSERKQVRSLSAKELERFFKAGFKAETWFTAVAEGIQKGHFDGSPEGNLRLLAFSKGYDREAKFSAEELLATLA